MAIKSFLSEGGFSVGSVGATPVEVIDSSGNVTAQTISGTNLTLSGNLTVNGSTVTVNATTVTVDDPIFTIGGDTAPTSDDNKDRGIEFRWHNGTAAKVGFFGYDDSAGKFVFVPDATNTSEVFSGTVGAIDLSGSLSAGSGISFNSGTGQIGNTGVLSIAGTSNQVTASASTGAITLSLPSAVTLPGTLTTTGNATIGGIAFLTDGSITAPSLAFTSTNSLGVYKYNANNLGIALGNASYPLILGRNVGSSYNYVDGTASNYLALYDAGAVSLVAGGTNQNITLTPSGTGIVTTGSNITTTGTVTAATFTDGYNTYQLAQINRGGGAVELQYNKSAAGDNVNIFGNTGNRWAWQADTGKVVLGSTGDTNLYRSAADTLKTDDSFVVGTNLTVSGTGTISSNLSVTDNGTAKQIRIGNDTTTEGLSIRAFAGYAYIEAVNPGVGYNQLRLNPGNGGLVTVGNGGLTVGGNLIVSGTGTSSFAGTVNIIGNGSGSTLKLDTGDQITYGYLNVLHYTNGAFIGTTAGTNTASNILRLGVSGVEKVRIDSAGNVGIGTSSPGATLEISKAGATDNRFIRLTDTSTSGRSWDIINRAGSSAGNFGIYDNTAGAYRLWIDTSGNVGLGGNTNPQYKLDVTGAVNTTDWYYVQNSGKGIFNSANSVWLASHRTDGLSLSSNTTAAGLILYSGGSTNTWRGWFYGDSSGQGFVDGSLNWQLNVDASNRLRVYSGIYNSDSGIRILNPGGAAYSTQTSLVTGAFKIRLPVDRFKSNTMIRMTVKIYQYTTGLSYEFEIGGYNYSDASATWFNIFAEQKSDTATAPFTIRYGNDGTANCIWIGETTTAWSYPQVFVTEFQGGYSGTTAGWASGWSITSVTTFDTVTSSRVASQVVTSNNISTVLTSTNGNLTIGGNATVSGGNLTLNNSGTGVIYFGPPSDNYIYYNGTNLYIRVGASDRLTLSTTTATFSGNLTVSGTGTSNFSGPIKIGSSAAQQKVQLDRASGTDSAYIQWQTAGSQNWVIGTGATGNDTNLTFYSYGGGGSVLALNNSTGAASVAGNLTVSGTASNFGGSANWNYVGLKSTGRFVQLASDSNFANDIFWDSGSALRFSTGTAQDGTGYSEKARLTSSGNLGIGTASPSTRLHLYNTSGDVELRMTADGSYNPIFRMTGENNGTGEGFTVTYRNAVGDTFFNNVYTGSTDAFHFQKGSYGSGTELVTIQNGGNVGIGTASPGYKLEVSGNALVSKLFISTANASYDLYNNGTTYLNGAVNTGGALTVGTDLSVTGNLTVNGTTTTVNSTTATVKDPILTLGGGNAGTAASSDDNKDRGIEFKWHNGTAAKTGFFGFKDSTGYLTFIPDATNTSEVFTGTVGDIDAGVYRGTGINVTGSITEASATDQALTLNATDSSWKYIGFQWAGTRKAYFGINSSGAPEWGSDSGNAFQLVGSSSLLIGGNTALHSGNYNSYAPTLTGTGASGTWGINVTGTAASETLATVTGRGASTSSNLTLSGTLSATGGSKITVQAGTDGGNSRGIMMWNDNDTNWAIYMAQSGAGKSIAAGTAAAGIDGRTAHHIRYRVANSSTQGHLWENSGEQALMQLTGDTGNLYTKGNAFFGNSTTGYLPVQLSLINSGSGTTGAIRFTSQPDGAGGYITFNGTVTANSSGTIVDGTSTITSDHSSRKTGLFQFVGGTSGTAGFSFFTSNAGTNATLNERLRIQHDGSVGIGTSSPSFRLSVIQASDVWHAQFGTSGGKQLRIGGSTTYGSVIGAYNDDGNSSPASLLLQRDGGNVGIGLSNPQYRVDISGAGSNAVTARLTNDNSKVRLYGYDLLGYNGANLWAISNSTSNQFTLGTSWDWDTSCDFTYTPGTVGTAGGSLVIGQTNKNNANYTHGYTAFYTNGTEKVRITSAGNLGVGTTSPSVKLHIAGSTIVANNTSINPDSYLNQVVAGAISTGGWGVSSAIGGSGNTGHAWAIGTNSTRLYFAYGDGASTNTLQSFIEVNTNRNMTLMPTSGSIGVGTASPSYKLHVAGDIYASSGAIRVNSTNPFYFESYGGGWFMQDTTWIRSYNSKNVWTGSGVIANDGGISVGYGGSTPPSGGVVISGSVGIGLGNGVNPTYKLEVNGSFAATTKSFVIPHPTKPGKRLRYGSLEGPENGVYVRGKLKGTNVIELPDYWVKLVDPESITVNLTPIGKHQKLYVADIVDNKVTVEIDGFFGGEINCFYTVFAERIDVEKLQVEVD